MPGEDFVQREEKNPVAISVTNVRDLGEKYVHAVEHGHAAPCYSQTKASERKKEKIGLSWTHSRKHKTRLTAP
jgi:hypothetical protein